MGYLQEVDAWLTERLSQLLDAEEAAELKRELKQVILDSYHNGKGSERPWYKRRSPQERKAQRPSGGKKRGKREVEFAPPEQTEPDDTEWDDEAE